MLVGAWLGAWAGRIVADFVLGLGDTPVLAITVAAGLVGGLLSVGEARSVEPWTAWDERDAYLGWLTFAGIVAVIVCLFLPIAWGLRGLAAAAVAALTIVVLRRAPPPPDQGSR